MTEDVIRRLTWEAATERFIQAAYKPVVSARRQPPLGHLWDRTVYGVETKLIQWDPVRRIFGAPDLVHQNKQICMQASSASKMKFQERSAYFHDRAGVYSRNRDGEQEGSSNSNNRKSLRRDQPDLLSDTFRKFLISLAVLGPLIREWQSRASDERQSRSRQRTDKF